MSGKLHKEYPRTVLGHYCKQVKATLDIPPSSRGGAIWGKEMALLKFTHTNIVFCLRINSFFVDAFGALLVWLSFGLALKYGICVVCGTHSCTHLPTKFGVGRYCHLSISSSWNMDILWSGELVIGWHKTSNDDWQTWSYKKEPVNAMQMYHGSIVLCTLYYESWVCLCCGCFKCMDVQNR